MWNFLDLTKDTASTEFRESGNSVNGGESVPLNIMLMIQNVICQIISDKIDSKFCINKTKILDFVKSIFGLFGTKMF